MKLYYFLLYISVFICHFFFVPEIRAADAGTPVVIFDDSANATISNGIVSAIIKKANGNLISLKYRGIEMLSKGGGYWNLYGNTPGQPNTQEKGIPSFYKITQDPKTNGGEIGEITLQFPYLGQPKTVPMDIEIRYTLHRGDTGLYGWTIADHAPQYPAFNMAVSTVCLKLNPEVFDFLSIDNNRQRLMTTPEDWVKGTQLNLWEARRINTGPNAGQVEHKYDYNFLYCQTPAYGWSSTKKKIGLFIVNPSVEYINGSATAVDYGGHIDVKAALPADPTLLFIWHTPHYGGRGVEIKTGEHWRKVIGPFLMYCTTSDTPTEMWKNALSRAEKDKKAWPFEWANAPGYEHANERGSISGSLIIQDAQAPKVTATGAWVGLAQAPYQANLGKAEPVTIDWQTDGKHYQYWTQADQSGKFLIPNARPGTYTLYAFTNGVLGDFSRADVNIEPGKNINLGNLTWVPVRYGKQLWDIGIPNRSAEEFRHGDHYWQWGLYNQYPEEFPNDVNYLIGKSDYHKDWNYAQPPKQDGRGGWANTTWRIRFNIDHVPKGILTLRLAICGARGGPVTVSINGHSIGTTGELPESGVMHRDGIRATSLIERDIVFDAALLNSGENVVELTKQAKAWTDGVLYDYVRLELNDEK